MHGHSTSGIDGNGSLRRPGKHLAANTEVRMGARVPLEMRHLTRCVLLRTGVCRRMAQAHGYQGTLLEAVPMPGTWPFGSYAHAAN